MMQFFIYIYAIFVAISAFSNKAYPENINSRLQNQWLTHTLNILAIVASSICLFTTYESSFAHGGSSPAMDQNF